MYPKYVGATWIGDSTRVSTLTLFCTHDFTLCRPVSFGRSRIDLPYSISFLLYSFAHSYMNIAVLRLLFCRPFFSYFLFAVLCLCVHSALRESGVSMLALFLFLFASLRLSFLSFHLVSSAVFRDTTLFSSCYFSSDFQLSKCRNRTGECVAVKVKHNHKPQMEITEPSYSFSIRYFTYPSDISHLSFHPFSSVSHLIFVQKLLFHYDIDHFIVFWLFSLLFHMIYYVFFLFIFIFFLFCSSNRARYLSGYPHVNRPTFSFILLN